MALSLKKGRDLSKYDLIACIDISGSTSGTDTASGQSRLDDSRKLTRELVREMDQIDTDGVTVHFYDDQHEVHDNTTFAKGEPLLKAVKPRGSTDTAGAIKRHIDKYLDKRLGKAAVPGTKGGFFSKGTPGTPAVPADPSTKPIIIVVITDGEPNDKEAVVKVIVDATVRLEAAGLKRDALGISFIQIGRNKPATDWLNELNNNLKPKGAKMDIVNCLTIEDCDGLTTTQILEKALDD